MSTTMLFQTNRIADFLGQGVDREANMIRGFAVATEGEAEGHGVVLDEITIGQIVELGNADPNGVVSRFTHPGLFRDSLGMQVGRVRNFRLDDNKARADLHFYDNIDSARWRDMREEIFAFAELDPESFGASVVGAAHLDGTDTPLVRFDTLRAVDLVGEPAANESLFSTDSGDYVARYKQQQDSMKRDARIRARRERLRLERKTWQR